MKKCTDQQFKENIRIGIKGEDMVYDYLVANNDFVDDLRNHKRGDGQGPCLKGTAGTLINPDFAVYNENGKCFAVDAKVKNSVYEVNKKFYFTVDNKFEEYKRVVRVKKLGFLMIFFIYNNRMFAYKDSEVADVIQYNNRYSSGNVYLFEFNKKRVI